MARITLKRGQEVVQGTNNDDVFFANEDNLDSGDIVNGGSGFDTFRFFADDDGGRFAAFELNDVERIEVTNDATNPVTFDLSGSFELRQFAVDNSSQSVTFGQIAALDDTTQLDITNTTTVAQTDVTMQFRNVVVAGDNMVTVNVADTDVSTVRIGSVGDADGGIETINLNVSGVQTTIDALDTDLTTLNITGSGAILIDNALNRTVRVIDAATATGALDLDFSAADSSVTVTGSQGDNTLVGGDTSSFVTTFAGDDVIDVGEGNNVVDAGDGSNRVSAGAGSDSITTGSGDDVIDAGEGNNTVDAGNGFNIIDTGNGSDTITGGRGTDVVRSGDGTDTISTDRGNDSITVGAGRHFVDAGAGRDFLDFGGNLDASVDAFGNPIGDIVDGGAGNDTLQINALNDTLDAARAAPTDQRDDERFDQVRSIEILQIVSAGRTYLGGANSVFGFDNAQMAGIKQVQLFTFGNDDLDASTFSSNLRVDSYFGGSDTVLTGSGSDTVNFYNTLDDSDVIDGGASGGRGDVLSADASTTLTTDSQFSAFETLRLDSGYRSNGVAAVYNVTLDNDNASSTGRLTIAASSLRTSVFGDETLTLDASAVTTYRLTVNSGAADDTLEGGALDDVINAGRGNDTVTAVGGDRVNGEAGNDTLVLVSGNNTAIGAAGRDTIVLGTGNDTVDAGSNSDTIVAFNDDGDQLTRFDVIDGGSGSDVLRVMGRSLIDTDFTQVSNVETLTVSGRGGSVTIGTEAQDGGIRTVILASGRASVLDASAYTTGLTVDAQAGGDDTVTTGSGADTVIAGVGDQTIVLGAGADTVVVDGNELDNSDRIDGGLGNDTIELDNVNANGDGESVSVAVNLDLVRSIERYAFSGDGTDPTNAPFGNLPDTYSLSFTGSVEGGVGSQTEIVIDASKLTDSQDATQIVLEEGLLDADYEFTILGSNTSTQVFKRNDGVNNNIDFRGAGGADSLYINGSDLGSTTIFDGGAGRDAVYQTGGLVTDDSYDSVTNVEVLTATGADSVDAILGRSASASGLVTVDFDNANANSVLLDAGFTSDLEVVLGDGNDTVLGAASIAKLSLIAQVAQVTDADELVGGSTAGDSIELHITGNDTADLTNMTGVETITMVDDTPVEVSTQTHLILDTASGEVTGGTQTVNAANSNDAYYIDAGEATANLVINLSESGNTLIDVVVTGDGNDTVDLGSAGSGGSTFGFDTTMDYVATGDGDDVVTGAGGMITTGDGNDTVTLDSALFAPNSLINLGDGTNAATTTVGNDTIQGGSGTDTIRSDGGSDAISGGGGQDTIVGGAGDDYISGGAGADTLSGSAGFDLFFYGAVTDSSTPTGRDTITDFTSGVDTLDFRDLVTPVDLGMIAFVGNADNFADAQGSVLRGSGMLQVVFEVDRSILWVDANDDGTLDANDVQIKLNGVSSITGADVLAGSATTAGGQAAFDAAHGFDTPLFTDAGVMVF